jgi:tRNA(fMet)-specific endonuclease VapC
MSHLLDTNSCIDHLRHGQASKVTAKLNAAPAGTIFLCSVVVAELIYGGWRSSNPAATLSQARTFCASLISLPFEDRAAEEYGQIRAHLDNLGKPIGPNDLLIASIARANSLTLVTHNTGEFSRVPGLQIEDWQ